MNDYRVAQDIKTIRGILGMTQTELAAQLGVEQVTISRNENGRTRPSPKFMEKVYEYAFDRKIRLNQLKEMFWKEDLPKEHRLLFHGAKSKIEGALSVHAGRKNNDFGSGFYAGESYDQAVSFVAGFEASSVYFLDFDSKNLKHRKYEVDQAWMMTIAYYRGTLEAYEDHPEVQRLIKQSRDCDYIIAPIADNRMFQIINSFIDGEITDEQCKHCLAATNLGSQYVFISDHAIARVKIKEHCYVCSREKEYYKNVRSSDAKLGDDKVRMARIRYRGKGRYIDEILS